MSTGAQPVQYSQPVQYQQRVQYPQYPQQMYQPGQVPGQNGQPEPEKESFFQKYFFWASPGIIIYLILWFLIIIASIMTVGCEVSCVPHASAQWSYETATFQNLN